MKERQTCLKAFDLDSYTKLIDLNRLNSKERQSRIYKSPVNSLWRIIMMKTRQSTTCLIVKLQILRESRGPNQDPQ